MGARDRPHFRIMKASDIDAIVIHCSATSEGLDIKASDINRMHLERGFAGIGYHYVVDLDGTIEEGRPLSKDGAHCNTKGTSGKSYNKHSIGICYIGGVDESGNAKDTRTDAQKTSLASLVNELVMKYPIVEILGHRDTSPDLNGDGKITSNEWVKQCPCFDVKAEFPISICTAKKK